jgi:prophage regulatory protein
MDEIHLHKNGFIRLPEILKLIPVGKSTFWAGVKTGRFPQPVKIGPRVTAWRNNDILKVLQSFK